MPQYIHSIGFSLLEAAFIFSFVAFVAWTIKLAAESPDEDDNKRKEKDDGSK